MKKVFLTVAVAVLISAIGFAQNNPNSPAKGDVKLATAKTSTVAPVATSTVVPVKETAKASVPATKPAATKHVTKKEKKASAPAATSTVVPAPVKK